MPVTTTNGEYEHMLTESISQVEIQKYEKKYLEELERQTLNHDTHFAYGVALIRSQYPSDMKRGIVLLEDLSLAHAAGNRDYLYYLALGYARIKKFSIAIQFLNAFIQAEPENDQVRSFRGFLIAKQKREAKIGMVVTTGSALVIGGLIGIGMALARR